ncbi:ABC-three component system protein [Pseudogulbenkiania ferrooxidans]|uniref:ABC-three component system protein n=1 Tax=Pseudogulbenkiania ferrooxidans TaxID=549169 RepID=UPI0012687440|nr:ABC-three component system protein [Pseudogulbenkiania ferrooxidans]
MRISYHDLNEDQFELLVVELCVDILGQGMQGFAKGPDGGRDGRFVGVAKHWPSDKSPWSGTIIVQAKHTSALNAKFSDPDFSGESESAILKSEAPKIKVLVENSQINGYLIFSNRKLGAIKNEEMLDYINKETGLSKDRVSILGIEKLDSLLKSFPGSLNRCNLEYFSAPLQIYPDDLAEFLLAYKNASAEINTSSNGISSNFNREKFVEKNERHGLSEEYANEIESRIIDFYKIDEFLSNPANSDLKDVYFEAVEEFNQWILRNRVSGEVFDSKLSQLIKLLLDRDSDLGRNRRLTSTMIYYMYWSCDCGYKKSCV